MTLTINIPDEVADDMMSNICAATDYDAASGKTEKQWAKAQLIRVLKNLAANGAMKKAMTTTKTNLDAADIN